MLELLSLATVATWDRDENTQAKVWERRRRSEQYALSTYLIAFTCYIIDTSDTARTYDGAVDGPAEGSRGKAPAASAAEVSGEGKGRMSPLIFTSRN